MTRYKAVIFDLFGTLVDNYSQRDLTKSLTEMATVLGVPVKAFMHLWNDETWPLRVVGKLPTVEATLLYICKQLNVQVDQEKLQAAVEARFTYTQQTLLPRRDAVETLTKLKESGYKLGLISDTSADVPELWPGTPLAPLIESALFSCNVGIRKPDPRIYLLQCERLDVQPADCLYIGDGGSQELKGARDVGMHPALLLVPYERDRPSNRSKIANWHGPVLSSVAEVLTLVNNHK